MKWAFAGLVTAVTLAPGCYDITSVPMGEFPRVARLNRFTGEICFANAQGTPTALGCLKKFDFGEQAE